MLKAQRQAAQVQTALRDIQAQQASIDASAKKADKLRELKPEGFGAKLLACKTQEEARKLLGI